MSVLIHTRTTGKNSPWLVFSPSSTCCVSPTEGPGHEGQCWAENQEDRTVDDDLGHGGVPGAGQEDTQHWSTVQPHHTGTHEVAGWSSRQWQREQERVTYTCCVWERLSLQPCILWLNSSGTRCFSCLISCVPCICWWGHISHLH